MDPDMVLGSSPGLDVIAPGVNAGDLDLHSPAAARPSDTNFAPDLGHPRGLQYQQELQTST